MVIKCPQCGVTRDAGEFRNIAAFLANGYTTGRLPLECTLQSCPCGKLVLMSPTLISWAEDPVEAFRRRMAEKCSCENRGER